MSGCANGGFGNGGFHLGPVIETEYVPQPEGPTNGGQFSTLATTTLSGGSFYLHHAVRFNRLHFEISAFAALADCVFLIYQDPRGQVVDDLPLVATVPFTPVGTGFESVAPLQGTVLLQNGVFYILWGQETGAGSLNVRCHNMAGLNLLNSNVPATVHPVNSTSALVASTRPTSVDITEGGDLTGAGTDQTPVIRLQFV